MKFITSLMLVFVCLSFAFAQEPNDTAVEPNTTTQFQASRIMMQIVLPDPNRQSTTSLESSIAAYDQTRNFLKTPLTDVQISQLTWAANMTMRSIARSQPVQSRPPVRDINSPIEFPFELYIFNINGVFQYDPLAHALNRTVSRDFRLGLSNAANKNLAINQAAMTILLVTTPAKKNTTRSRFNEYAQAGQIAQSVALQAVGMGLGSLTTSTFDQNLVRRVGQIPATRDPIYMITIGQPVGIITTRPVAEGPKATIQKSIAIIVPEKDFSDPELFDLLDSLDLAGIGYNIASTTIGPREGMSRGRATATLAVADLNLRNYDAIVFIGGVGTLDYYRNNLVLALVQSASDDGMVVGGIGEGAALIAKAGLLPPERTRQYDVQRQYRLGTNQTYGTPGVQTEAGIITASGPTDSTLFARAIVNALKGESGLQLPPQENQRPAGRMRLGERPPFNKQQSNY